MKFLFDNYTDEINYNLSIKDYLTCRLIFKSLSEKEQNNYKDFFITSFYFDANDNDLDVEDVFNKIFVDENLESFISHIIKNIDSDDVDDETKLIKFITQFESFDNVQKFGANQFFITLCGYSFETLLDSFKRKYNELFEMSY